jgi:hypothetical protein
MEEVINRVNYKPVIDNPEGKRPLGRHGCRWEENIKIDLKETGCEGVDYIKLAQ